MAERGYARAKLFAAVRREYIKAQERGDKRAMNHIRKRAEGTDILEGLD